MDVKKSQEIRGNKGMTLIEVILALAVSSLFFCCILDLTGRGIMMNQKIQEENNLRREMNRIKLFVEEQFDQAKKLTVYDQEDRIIFSTERDYIIDEEKVLKSMIFEEKLERHEIKWLKYQKNNKQLFKMTYGGQTLTENIQNITIIQQEQWLFITCTLVGKIGTSLSEEILLSLTYK